MSRKQQIKKNLKVKTPLPPQLRARVKSGAISKQRAVQTAQERQTFKAAFGKDWRQDVYGKGGARGLTGPFSKAQIRTKRAQALSQAQKKLHGGLGGNKAVQGTLSAPKPTLGPRKFGRRKKRFY